MSPDAVAVMAVICTFVWGGFVLLLTRAVRKEGAKESARTERAHPGPPSS